MKTTIRTIALATLVAIASLSQTVIAQTGDQSLKVNVPFVFDYGTQHFPPGVYSLSLENQNILVLHSGDHSARVMIQTGYDPTQRKSGYVAFRKYGERYFLTEFVPAAGSIHASIFESSAERHAAHEFAAVHQAPIRVQLEMMSNAGTGELSK